MILIHNVSKQINDVPVLDRVNMTIAEGRMTSIMGERGSGKTTLMRIMAGVLRPDEGIVVVDDRPVFDNPLIKQRMFFVSDDPYLYEPGRLSGLRSFYADTYGRFDDALFDEVRTEFELADDVRKGKLLLERKKTSLAIGACLRVSYLLIDDPFAGISRDESAVMADMMRFSRDRAGCAVICACQESEASLLGADFGETLRS